MATKKVTKDYGLRQHEVESITPETPEEAERLIAELNRMMSPGQVRSHNAQLLRDALQKAGTSAFDPEIKAKLGQEAFHVLGAEWLRNYEWLQKSRAKIENGNFEPKDIARMIDLAEKLGQLTERIWWRQGVDPLTGAKRENLAVAAQKSRRALPKARAARDAHNAEEKAKADEWKRTAQRLANGVWNRNNGLKKTAVAHAVRADWNKHSKLPVPNITTLRLFLKKPDNP